MFNKPGIPYYSIWNTVSDFLVKMHPRQRSDEQTLNMPSQQELSAWAHIIQEFQNIHQIKIQNDAQINKLNRAHEKVVWH